MAYVPKKKQDNVPNGTKKKNNDAEFAKGVFVSQVDTKYGAIVKLGINVELFCENEISETGFVNIELKANKDGKWYAVLQKKFEK